MKLTRTAFAFTALLYSSPAIADVAHHKVTSVPTDTEPTATDGQFTAAELLGECTVAISPKDSRVDVEAALVKSGHCIGFLAGVMDTLVLTQQFMTQRLICLPPSGVPILRAIAILGRALRLDPALRRETARAATFMALATEFPCETASIK